MQFTNSDGTSESDFLRYFLNWKSKKCPPLLFPPTSPNAWRH